MPKCTRHFNALMRKNFILWWRMPGCAAFELLAPIVLMIVLTIIRNKVPTVPTDQAGMLSKKAPVMPGIGITNGKWAKSTSEDNFVDLKVRPFFGWADYSEGHTGSGYSYQLAWDWTGPQFYAPTQCLKTSDWNRPRKSSPLIGTIGTETNLTQSVSDYMVGIRKTQFGTAAKLAVPYY